MLLTIGQAGDEELNPTVYWPKDRQTLKAGVLTITKAYAQKGADCEKINFDPLVMSDGVSPTADPVLNFRSTAYASSFARRLTNN
jgi:catalase